MNDDDLIFAAKPAAALPRRAIVAPTDAILQAFLRKLRALTEEQPPRRSLLNFSSLFVHSGVALAGPCVGAPACLLVAETLAASGVEELFLLGAAGGISFGECSVDIGDVLLPTGAFPEDGTSRLYGAGERIEHPWGDTQDRLLEVITAGAIPVKRGMIWTTDAPYLETRKKLREFHDRGAAAVEMEYAALLQFCTARKLALAAAFVVSDLRGDQVVSGFGHPNFRSALGSVVDIMSKLVLE